MTCTSLRQRDERHPESLHECCEEVMRYSFPISEVSAKHLCLIGNSLLESDSVCCDPGIQMMLSTLKLFIVSLSSTAVSHQIPKSNFQKFCMTIASCVVKLF